MPFKLYKSTEKQHAITIKSPNGNTVGHINLSNQFLKAMTSKEAVDVTPADINALNNGKLLEYLATMDLEITNPTAVTPITNIKDY